MFQVVSPVIGDYEGIQIPLCCFWSAVVTRYLPSVSVYNSERQLFVLNFRGLSFEFHIESKFEVSDERLDNTSLLCFGEKSFRL